MVKILFVEPEVERANIITQRLAHREHIVETSYSGEMALTKFRNGNYDCVFVSNKSLYPDISGDEVARRMRDTKPRIPIYIHTFSGLDGILFPDEKDIIESFRYRKFNF